MNGDIQGVIDIGSNSVRLLLARVNTENVIVEEQHLETTRLGAGFSQKKHLENHALERTVKVVNKYWWQAQKQGALSTAVLATSAVREAINCDHFKQKIYEATGKHLYVLSEREEALLSFRGAVRSLDFAEDRVTVFDLGGGSTEFIWSKAGEPETISFPVGVVKLQEKFDLQDQPGEVSMQKTKEYMQRILQPLPRLPAGHKLVGVGGTVTTLAAINIGLKEYDPRLIHGSLLNYYDVEMLQALLSSTPLDERYHIPGLKPDRADVIVAGVLAVSTIMVHMGSSQLYVSEGDLLTGFLAQNGQKIHI